MDTTTRARHHLTHYSGDISPQPVADVTEYRVVMVTADRQVIAASNWFDTMEEAAAHYDALSAEWHGAALAGEAMENGRHLQFHARTLTTTNLYGCVVSPGR